MTSLSTEWTDEPFTHPPVAVGTGPFPESAFLETWWRHQGGTDRLALVTSDAGALPLRVSEGTVMFCGDADLTDYHSPLGDPRVAIEAVSETFRGHQFSFDSLPEEAASVLGDALEAGGHEFTSTRESMTAVIDLPDDPEAWLAALRKKDRHEIRRKRRRFSAILGEASLERRSDQAAVTLFAEMHRSASGNKAGFMSQEREAFFSDLIGYAGATIDVLVTERGPIAAAFAFDRNDGYFLYNSAYTPEAAASSPGIVLLATVIEMLIAKQTVRLDLLKGNEAYKFRLGAAARPLYRIEGTFA
ncbi:MAG: hypothetical protein BMS9Abin07_1780 [Acidimicrobiia bacterium]|nr:MAG: hypothetical protein BMS9Abin07_1780 [Acidimicrobiia bacterium]